MISFFSALSQEHKGVSRPHAPHNDHKISANFQEFRVQRRLCHRLLEFFEWCKEIRDNASLLPKSKLFEAVRHVLNHWNGLTVYLEHGIVSISNVVIEQHHLVTDPQLEAWRKELAFCRE
jgi:hypothetical protein